MIISCFRCQKELESPNSSNADYIMAEDTKVTELAKDGTPVEIQKTGIICPDCYKLTDKVIWGIHKEV
jgi:DNA-directed RNA polymerase subunit RPC12/RpoP